MFTSLFSTLLVVSLVVLNLSSGAVYATPALNARQVGDLQCNLDRGQVVKNLAIASKNVGKLTNSTNVNNATVFTAQEGLDDANAGVQTIAQALKQGQTAPANARTQVEDGLAKAQTALSGANSTDKATTWTIMRAQIALNKTITAAQGVIDNCK